ncbi:hypothetical protein D6C85_08510 [Aureobasidium pullulans]|uniref:Peroxisomal membrane protein PEX14 n=1 Tax=Aureobasidium pullulans TaxID=5580 RepID=A0A4S9QSH8_AURPU|nr:hypothetical protein D6D21_01057 [Aureobasidium pullulans]THX34800.1 hypothetical protein D6D12_00760 [Aureobasidium pullulans]THX46480.1 hypothetical protein D6D11_06841 [Aureobasidium pullulans]THY41674.1 hypothetical protein D6C99_07740 [Aureobasidium pullulans]THY85634.1 hypothetical protein D6C92_08808 [Aureobasidium pullulans]
MSDKKDLPTWQRHATDASAQAAKQEHDASLSAVHHVRKFLEDPAVKDAPLDKKKAFLLSKNVSEDMIYQVLGSIDAQDATDTDGSKEAARQEFEASKAEPSTDGSTEAAKQEFDASKKSPQPPSYVSTTDGSTEAAKQEFDASKALSFSAAEFKATNPSTTPAPAPQRRDVPPIITYPEFLVQPQKPPPLVTVSRLINATYIAGALTASAYALSKYIIAPMADNLNDARHDLFEHTIDHVSEFNDKLSKLVSTVPSSVKSLPQTPAEFADFDNESVTSDPTELFHRDVGTQTSPSLSRRPSVASDIEVIRPDTVPLKQTNRLEIMKSHISEILEGSESNGASNQTLQESISETRHYLDGLYYTPPSYSWNADNSLNTSGTSKDKQPDAAVALKAEIRGVKGVLLSAKRFPSGRVGA